LSNAHRQDFMMQFRSQKNGCRPWLARAGFALIGGYAAAHGAALLGMALPLSRIDAGLTAGMFSCAVLLPVVFWMVGAPAGMRLCFNVLLSGTVLVTLILLLPWG
jgi:hypothetical protein